jgi:V8-like Glu-specific endopeptidase
MKPLKWTSYELAPTEPRIRSISAAEVSPQAKNLLVAGVSSSSLSETRDETQIGADDRIRVTEPGLHPWRMIASLDIQHRTDPSPLIGTGWFVHPKVLLTAGHCIHDNDKLGGLTRGITVLAGRGNGVEPFGRHRAVRVAALERWIEHRDEDFDVGCIFLDRPVGEDTGVFNLHAPTDAELINRLVNISGYPREPGEGKEQYFHANRVQAATARSVFYDVDTKGGQSGAPVFAQEAPNAPATAIGLHAYGTGRTNGVPPLPGGSANSGPRLTAELLATIQAWINSA